VVPIVLVDARNVLRSQWPNIPEQKLVERVQAWAAAEGVGAVIVFDGRAPSGVIGRVELDERCSLVGSGGESADEWLIRESARLLEAGERFWLVTSDRALRAAAGEGAERTIGGGTFARQLSEAE
jgi:predicted RNA-binding protein with PIN domain